MRLVVVGQSFMLHQARAGHRRGGYGADPRQPANCRLSWLHPPARCPLMLESEAAAARSLPHPDPQDGGHGGGGGPRHRQAGQPAAGHADERRYGGGVGPTAGWRRCPPRAGRRAGAAHSQGPLLTARAPPALPRRPQCAHGPRVGSVPGQVLLRGLQRAGRAGAASPGWPAGCSGAARQAAALARAAQASAPGPANPPSPPVRPPAQWAGQLPKPLDLEDYSAEVAAFKAQYLYPHIASRDAEEGVNATWLRGLNEAAYRFSDWATQARRGQAWGGGKLRARCQPAHALCDLPPLPGGSGAQGRWPAAGAADWSWRCCCCRFIRAVRPETQGRRRWRRSGWLQGWAGAGRC